MKRRRCLLITSIQNPRIKAARALLQRKGRREGAAFLLEGLRLLEEAVHAGLCFEQVFYYAEGLRTSRADALLGLLRERGVELCEVSEKVLQALSQTEKPQGLVAQALQPQLCVPWNKEMRLLVVDRVQDPGNLGTMIRLAAAFACQAVVLLEGSVDPWNDKAMRASMGATFLLPLLELKEADLLVKLRQFSLPLRVADPRGERALWELDWRSGWALVVGNEGAGVSETLLKEAEARFIIPMPGRAESLNAGSATAISLYEASRAIK